MQAGGSVTLVPDVVDAPGIDVAIYAYKDAIGADMAAADLVIGHAGAGTALEVLRLHKPLLMVINEQLMDNHQLELAESLRELRHVSHCTPLQLADHLIEIESMNFERFPEHQPARFSSFLDQRLFGL